MPSRIQADSKASSTAFAPGTEITSAQSLAYSRELLESLEKIALRQDHKLLARLLRLAIQEVQSLERGED